MYAQLALWLSVIIVSGTTLWHGTELSHVCLRLHQCYWPQWADTNPCGGTGGTASPPGRLLLTWAWHLFFKEVRRAAGDSNILKL